MRKLFFALLLLGCSSQTIIEAPPGLIFGDVDGNGVIDITDADLLFAVTTGSAVNPIALIQACGDVNGDNQVSVLDAYYVYAYLQGDKQGRVGEPCKA